MERFTKKLDGHLKLVKEHAMFLIKRFTGYYLRAQKIVEEKAIFGESVDRKNNKQVKALYLKMKLIQIELECVESFIKLYWPDFFKIYIHVKQIDLGDLSDKETDESKQEDDNSVLQGKEKS